MILERLDNDFFPQRIKDDFIKKLAFELSPKVCMKLPVLGSGVNKALSKKS